MVIITRAATKRENEDGDERELSDLKQMGLIGLTEKICHFSDCQKLNERRLW